MYRTALETNNYSAILSPHKSKEVESKLKDFLVVILLKASAMFLITQAGVNRVTQPQVKPFTATSLAIIFKLETFLAKKEHLCPY